MTQSNLCICGNQLKYKTRTFCSIQCSNKHKWINNEKFAGVYKKCVICNSDFLIKKRTRVNTRKTCSIKCRQALSGRAGAKAVHKKYNDFFLKEIEIIENKRELEFQEKIKEKIRLENEIKQKLNEYKKNKPKIIRNTKKNFVTLTCTSCSISFSISYKKRKRKFCTLECYRKSLSGVGNPAYGKVYKTKLNNPEWAANIGKGLKKAEVNVGEKNAMKRPEIAFKMSQTRSKMLQDNPDMRKEMSDRLKDLWNSGRMIGVNVGRCKWYDVTRDGITYKAQGTWERDFITWMLKSNIKFRCHRSKFDYQDDEGAWHRYFPDFYVESWNAFVDIKSDYIESINKRKLELVKEYNPNLELILIKKDFIDFIRHEESK